MTYLLPLAMTGLSAAFFGALVPTWVLDDLILPVIYALPIMAAALVLRGGARPRVEGWEGIDPVRRNRLSRRLIERAGAYRVAVTILSGSFVILCVVLAVGNGGMLKGMLSPGQERLVAAVVGGLLGLCGSCLPEVLRREMAIAELEKRLIDALPNPTPPRPAKRRLRLVVPGEA